MATLVAMTSKNLTRDEATARAELLRVNHYSIDLDLSGAPVGTPHSSATFASKTTIQLTAKRAGSTFVDLRDATVNSVAIDGVDATEAAAYHSDTGINLELTEGDHEVVIDANCRYTNNGQGLHRFQDPADGETYLYSQFETADAKRVFACFDQPDLKATYSMHVVAPKGWKVISNSPAVTGTATDPRGNETVTFDFSVDVPLSTYLVAVCAGPWHEVTDSWSGTIAPHPETPTDHQPAGELTIPLGIYCRRSVAEHLDADTLFKETKEGFDFYAKHFGEPYAFGKYDQVFCPEYNMGAMENAGCVTLRDEYVFRSKPTAYLFERRNDTILHEMAHMWFGDLVTMKWWDDLWLNESFATWSAAVAQAEVSDFKHAWTTFANVEKSWAYKQDQLPSTHPIAADASDINAVEQNFDGITYAKGASTLKQLAAYVGQDAFLAGARLHFARHRFGNATFADLLEALSEASGRDLSGWAGQWLTTTGITTLAPEFEQESGKYTSFAVTQEGAQPGAGEVRDHRIAVGIYNLRGTGDETVLERTQRVEIDVHGTRTEVPELVGTDVGDLVLVNDDDLTYSMIRLDSHSLDTAVNHIAAIKDPMPRTLCWSATWQMVRAGQMRARDFVALVLRGIPGEDQLSVLERIIAQAVSAVDVYADPKWAADSGRDLLAKGLLEYAQRETDAERALIFVNALATVGSSASEIVAALRALYDGEPTRAELRAVSVDTDMRWRALRALVAAGQAGETEIAALAETDKSALGTQAAIASRASVPTLANKTRVWAETSTTGESAPSNLAIRHLLLGFNAPGADTVLRTPLDDDARVALGADGATATLAEHYFKVANSWWQEFSSETAQNLLEGFYPTWEISQEAIDSAQALLDDPATVAPVKRIISEQQFLVRLALRARDFDAK